MSAVSSSVVLLSPNIFCPLDMSIDDRRMLTSLTLLVDLSTSPCSFISFCFMYFDVLFLGAYTLRVLIFSWIVDLFIIMECPTLNSITFLALKSTLSEIGIATPISLN